MRSKVVNSFAYSDSQRDETPNPASEQTLGERCSNVDARGRIRPPREPYIRMAL